MENSSFIPVDTFEKERRYWLDKLAGDLSQVKLLSDFPRGNGREEAAYKLSFGEEITRELMRISKNNDLSLFVLLLTAFKILLFKYTGQNEIIVSSPTYSISRQEYNRNLVFRDFVSPRMTFKELLLKVKQTVADGYKNQYFPVRRLLDLLDIKDNFSLFRVIVLLETIHDRASVAEVTVDFENDILVSIRKAGETGLLEADIIYNSGLFKRETIQRLFDSYLRLLSQVCANTNIVLKDIRWMTEEEQHEVLYRFNDTTAEYPSDKTIHCLFEEQARRTPDNTAVGLADEHVTYDTLNGRSRQLARVLREKGVRPESIVGLLMGNSLEMVIGIIGVLKAGGAYLPIDPDYPEDRISYLVEDSSAKMLVTKEWCREQAMPVPYESHAPCSMLHARPENLAYIIYTSGTTGKPKGTLVEHRGIVNYTHWRLRAYQYTERDITLQLLSYCFDGFGSNFYSSLLSGGILLMVPEPGKTDYGYINEVVRKRCVTNISLVPGMYEALLDIAGTGGDLKTLRFVVLAGERAGGNLLEKSRQRYPNILHINEYGPTETTVTAAANTRMMAENTANIGTPISNSRIYILDEKDEIVPVGVPGELCISGCGVSRGYLNNPKSTAAKFTACHRSYRSYRSYILYRTGDLARWLGGGPLAGGTYSIELLGRIDQQVKIRGYRIELGEIENHLLQHEKVKEVVVTALHAETGAGSGDTYLCCYFASDETLEETGLKAFLAETLPDYMIPATFFQIEKIPLTPNGKVDRKALPLPVPGTGALFTAPGNETEEKLAAIWADVLGIKKESIGIDHNFFHLGGQSLKATVLAAKIHKVFDVKISLEQMFKLTTIRRLAQYIKESQQVAFIAIEPAEKREYYPLSSAQKRLYLLQQRDLESTAYNIPERVVLEEAPGVEQLQEILIQLIQRHESLRTSFEIINGEPVQRVHDHVEFSMEHGAWSMEGRDFVRPFDLSRAPLLRAALVETGETFIFMVDMHHIISDGVSRGVLINDFTALYRGEHLPALNLHYKDFSLWQHRQVQSGVLKKQETFWLKQFAGEIPQLALPLDYPRPEIQSFAGDAVRFNISEKEAAGLRELAKIGNATLFMVLLTVYNVLLARLGSQEDIVVGTAAAGRRHTDLEHVIGMFVNTLALRNQPTSQKTFRSFLKEVKERTLQVFENQDYQFEDLVQRVAVKRDLSRNPLFDAVLGVQNIDIAPGQEQDRETRERHEIKEVEEEAHTAKFDITLHCADAGKGLAFGFEYCTKLFKKETVERFIRYFKTIVSGVIETPGKRIGEIEIIPEQEKKQVLLDFSNANEQVWYPEDKTIHQLFEEQAGQTPDRTAIHKTHRTYRTYMTYKKLNETSNQLAGLLRKKGLESGAIAAIMAERCFEMVIGIMAVLKAGGAYLPIDPQYPEERIRYMLEDSGAKILLTNLPEGHHLFNSQLSIVNYQLLMSSQKAPFHHSSFINHHSSSLAYVIYTSGSTGKPKGVMIAHRGIANLSVYHRTVYRVNERDRVVQFASSSFDASVWEMFMALLNGAALYLLDQEVVGDHELFEEYLQANAITIATLPPPYAVHLNPDKLTSLRLLITAGSPASPGLVEKWRARVEYINAYGPTETTICASAWHANDNSGALDIVPIGRPINNTCIYILDKDLKPSPIGVPGELCVSGITLAWGYLNRPDLTAENFSGFYHTGDLARWLPDGNIEFLGRIDEQVKIRGYRIELGEIENQLLKYRHIKDAAAVVREEQGYKYLCAYIVVTQKVEPPELREYLSKALPAYMIPAHFLEIDNVPLTPSGKVDRKALPIPSASELLQGSEYVAPRAETEEQLAEIWSEILGIERDMVSIDFDFFELGGDSLRATTLVARVHHTLHIKIPLAEVFQLPTIRELAQYINKASVDKHTAVEPAEKKDYYALSSAQKRLYILQQIELESTAYNMPEVVPLGHEVDMEKLQKTFKQLINRHESLRTSFHMIDDEPVQKVHEQENYKFQITNYNQITKNFVRPFDLSQAPLLRVGLIKSETRDPAYLLLVDMHHIISDGVSHGILEKDFTALYQGRELPPLRIQYKDFAQWQKGEKEKEKIKQQQAYWLKTFAGEVPVLNLPTDYVRPVVQGYEGSSIGFVVGKQETEALKQLALEQGGTLYMVLLAVMNILLAKLGNQEDIVVGTPTAGRRHADLEKIIGMFVNTLALRNYPGGEKIFKDFLGEVKEHSLEAFENQEYPFEDLVDRVVVNRDAGRNPLFDAMFVLQNIAPVSPGPPQTSHNREEQSHPRPGQLQSMHTTSKFDMTLTAAPPGKELDFRFTYNTALFKKESIERFSGYFKKIVSAVVKNPGRRISEIEIISAQEKQHLLFELNDTCCAFPGDRTIHRLFEAQAARAPDRIALVGPVHGDGHAGTGGRSFTSMTYKELNRKSGQLAFQLRTRGISPDSTAALMTEPSIAVVLGIIAVLKTGGCYLPIDPENPEGRIDYILNDSETGLLLTQRHLINKVAFAGEILDIEDEDLYREEVPSPGKSGGPDNDVYMIYTSGTTGTPKGVLVTHRNLVNYVTWFSRAAGVSGEDKTPLTSSFAFDLGYTSVYPSLLAGGQLHLLSRETYMFAPGLLDYICSRRISYVKMTPSLFSTIVEDSHFSKKKCKTLRLAVLGGEAINTADVEKAHRVCRHIKIMNHYGPTEVTIGSVAQFIDFERLEEYKTRPTIGRPIFNSNVFILDKYLKLLPLGIAGELCLSGVGVAKGYFKRDALTSEKFININTFMEKAEVAPPYDRVYRTGDLARWLPHRNIEFLGRIDHQVKIRGYRIELGEIEGQLLNHPAVKDTVVLVLGKNSADKNLCAYVVPGHAEMSDNPPLMWAELKKYLSHSLPGYMVPAHFKKIDKVPLTPNGKLDRRALPVPDVGDRGEYTPPGDIVEEQLVKIWADLLSIDISIIGIDADFFQLGGHSLKATIMAARIQDAFNVRFPLSEVFKTPTIRSIAEYTRLAGIGSVTGKEKNLVLLKPGVNSNHHLFLVHDGTGEVEAYMEFCDRLTDQFNYWGLRADRLEDLAPQNRTIEALAQRYVEIMRKVQAHGPYYLAGWSLGGTVAFEMARQLEQVEEKITFLALIDSVPPHKDLWKEAQEFDLESELDFIKGYPINDELKERLKNAAALHQVWLLAADYLETKNIDAGIIKNAIAGDYGIRALPNYQQLSVRESLYYLNVSRTLRNARASYIPSGKINTRGHFFKADQSRFKYRPWNAYCRKPFLYHKVHGDHYSIFRQPHAGPFAHTFNQVIKTLLKNLKKEKKKRS